MNGADATRDVATCPEPGELPRASQRWPRFGLACRVESYEDGDECTVFPVDADADEVVTTWVTAEEGSFVGLEEMR